MIKAIFLGLLKVFGGIIIFILLGSACFYYNIKRPTGGFEVGWFSVKYYYKKNGHEQWTWNRKKVRGVHRPTFEIVEGNGAYAKDKNRVYYKWHFLEDSDPATFSPEFLNQHLLSRDKQQVYYGSDLVSKDADHFERIDKVFFKDEKQVYYLTRKPKPNLRNESHIVKVPKANPKTFSRLPEIHGLSKDDQHVFYNDKVVEKARLENLREVDGFWTDGYTLFRNENVVEGADMLTFEKLNYPYSRDKDQVFFKHELLNGANPNAFEMIDDLWKYSKDEDQIFCRSKELVNADIPTFQKVEGASYFKDKGQVYYEGQILPGANPNFLQLVIGSDGRPDWRFVKDKQFVYCEGRKLEGANAATFTFKGKDRYGNDKWTDGELRFDRNGERL